MKSEAILIGVDVGTSATKVVAFDVRGRALASASRDYPLSTPHPGWAEQDPDDWWRAAVEALRAVTRRIPASRVAGLSLSGQMHGAVFLDSAGRVIRPAMLWCDGRTGAECERIVSQIGREALLATIKNLPLASFTLPKLLWLAAHEPMRYCRLHLLLLPKDYVRYRLTGQAAIDYSDAAGTAMLEVGRGRWAEEMLFALGLDPAVLPPLIASSAVAGELSVEAARATGLPPGLPVVAGGGDQPVGAVGVGVFEEGQAMLSLGTSGVVLAPTAVARAAGSGGLASFDHAVTGRSYLMGCILSAGGALQWYRNTLCAAERDEARRARRDVYDLLIERAAGAPPGAEGLLFLPYLMGERTPHPDPAARGAWVGLSARHDKACLTRALLEGVSFALRDALELVRGHDIELSELRATGGGARSRFWLQMLADVCGLPVRPMKAAPGPETHSADAAAGPALGAAVLAGIGVGVYADFEEASRRALRPGAPLRPNPRRRDAYDAAYARYRALYPALRDLFQNAPPSPPAAAAATQPADNISAAATGPLDVEATAAPTPSADTTQPSRRARPA